MHARFREPQLGAGSKPVAPRGYYSLVSAARAARDLAWWQSDGWLLTLAAQPKLASVGGASGHTFRLGSHLSVRGANPFRAWVSWIL